jgi:hypothetical protein
MTKFIKKIKVMTKWIFSLLGFLLVFTHLHAQTKQPIPSKIEKVTVFLKGAQITRKATANLSAGKTELVFKDISPNLDKQSIQVKGDGAFTILSVIHQLNHLQEQEKRDEIAQLEGKKNRLNEQKKVQNAQLAVFRQEEEMLKKNQAIGGQNVGVSTDELLQAVDFQRKRMTEVLMKQLEIAQEIARMDSTLQKLDKQLTALHQKKETATSEILVSVSAKTATSARFELSYYVKDAGWFANYDLRVKDVSSPIDLAFKANVFQNSGEDWKDVKLVLSNGDPTVSGAAQELEPWYLRFGYTPPPVAYKAGLGSGGITQVSGVVLDGESGEPLIGATISLKGSSIGTVTDMDGRFLIKISPQPATLLVSYVGYSSQEVAVNSSNMNISMQGAMALNEVVVTGLGMSGRAPGVEVKKQKQSRADETIAQQTQEVYQPTTINFEIEEPYTILNDGKTYTVDIKAENVPASYEYFAAPKLEEAAYLTAYITNWQDLNLLDGEVNIFFEGSYLGKSLLDTRNTGDTLNISLGQDKGIIVKRTKLKDYSSRQFIGGNKTERRSYEILVKNNKQQPVNITIQDQLPIPTDKEISVEDQKYDGAELEKETQLLTWKLKLAPREERKLNLQYAVKYPKGKTLVLD